MMKNASLLSSVHADKENKNFAHSHQKSDLKMTKGVGMTTGKAQTLTTTGTTIVLTENQTIVNVATATVIKRKKDDQEKDVVVSTFLDVAKTS